MKRVKKFLCGIVLSTFVLSSYLNVFALDQSSEKEEVIYVMTNLDGSTKYIYAVNIFDGGEIIDYGNYSSVKMLTSNDKIQVNEDMIEIKSDEDKVYYEGTMENTEIPWNISVKYFLNGEEIFGNELGGKSGQLKIKLDINKNENYTNGSFYDDFALQVILKLDTDISKNIISNGATVANIGKKKQLLYTILPGKNLETEITCDIKDFEMDAIEINGVKMNFNIDVDSSSMNDEVNSLKNGISDINNGANNLKNGIGNAKSGGNKLQEGINSLKNGTNSLDEGIEKLKSGIESARDGFQLLNEKSDMLSSSSAKFKGALLEIQKSISEIHEVTANLGNLSSISAKFSEGIGGISQGIQALSDKTGYESFKGELSQKGLDIDSLRSKNAELNTQIKSQINLLTNKVNSLEDDGKSDEANEIRSQIDVLNKVSESLQVNSSLYGGMEAYLNGLKDAQEKVLNSTLDLKNKFEEFNSSIQKISANFGDMILTVNKFAGAIGMLVENYSKLDSGIIEYTEGVKKLSTGYGEIVNGIQAVSNGSKTLKNGVNELGNGSLSLSNGLNQLYNGAVKLNDGTTTLKNKTSNLDTTIEDKINKMLENIKGENKEITSFTSDKNTNVKSVQFVIKSDAIIKPKVEENNDNDKQHIGFWKKLTNLFKKN